MEICKANLDVKVNSKYTLAEDIRRMEEHFKMTHMNPYLMRDIELKQYYEYINYLCGNN